MSLAQAVNNITRGEYSPADISALSAALNGYLSDDKPLGHEYHRGLRQAVLELRWRSHIAKAVALLDFPGVTTRSIAEQIAKGFTQAERSRRPDPLLDCLRAALRDHPTGGRSISALWPIVSECRSDTHSNR